MWINLLGNRCDKTCKRVAHKTVFGFFSNTSRISLSLLFLPVSFFGRICGHVVLGVNKTHDVASYQLIFIVLQCVVICTSQGPLMWHKSGDILRVASRNFHAAAPWFGRNNFFPTYNLPLGNTLVKMWTCKGLVRKQQQQQQQQQPLKYRIKTIGFPACRKVFLVLPLSRSTLPLVSPSCFLGSKTI
jgi:hypothetical protein